MGNLSFPNGICEFDYDKYGIYIPFIYHMMKAEGERYREWHEEISKEWYDKRYKENRKTIQLKDGKKVTESFSQYLDTLCWNPHLYSGICSSFKFTDLSWIIDELKRDREIKIGKYKIIHNLGYFGYRELANGDYQICEEYYEIYCNDNLFLTIYNGGFEKCIEKIIEDAGGFESWKMLNEGDV